MGPSVRQRERVWDRVSECRLWSEREHSAKTNALLRRTLVSLWGHTATARRPSRLWSVALLAPVFSRPPTAPRRPSSNICVGLCCGLGEFWPIQFLGSIVFSGVMSHPRELASDACCCLSLSLRSLHTNITLSLSMSMLVSHCHRPNTQNVGSIERGEGEDKPTCVCGQTLQWRESPFRRQ